MTVRPSLRSLGIYALLCVGFGAFAWRSQSYVSASSKLPSDGPPSDPFACTELMGLLTTGDGNALVAKDIAAYFRTVR